MAKTLENIFDSELPNIDRETFDTFAKLLGDRVSDIVLIYAEGKEVPHNEDGISYVQNELLAKTKGQYIDAEDVKNGRYIVHQATEIPLFVDTPHGLHYLTEIGVVSNIYEDDSAEQLEIGVSVKDKTYDFTIKGYPGDAIVMKPNVFNRAKHFMDLFEAFGFEPVREYTRGEK